MALAVLLSFLWLHAQLYVRPHKSEADNHLQGVLLFFVLAIFASTLLVEVDELMQQLNDRNDPRHQPYSEGLRLALKLMVTMVLICWLLMLVGIIADFVLCGLPSNMLSPIARSGRRIMTQLRRRRQFVVLPFRAQSKKQPALELQPSPSGRSMMIGPVEAKAKQPARGEVRDTKVTTGGAAEAKQKLAAQPRADAAANAAVTTPRVQPASKQPIPRATNIRDGMALKAQGGATLPADTRVRLERMSQGAVIGSCFPGVGEESRAVHRKAASY